MSSSELSELIGPDSPESECRILHRNRNNFLSQDGLTLFVDPEKGVLLISEDRVYKNGSYVHHREEAVKPSPDRQEVADEELP